MEHTVTASNLERKLRLLKRDISRLDLAQSGRLALKSHEQTIPFTLALEEAEGYLQDFLSVWDERSNLQALIIGDTFPSDKWMEMYDEARLEVRQARISLATIKHQQQSTASSADVTDRLQSLNTSVLGRSNLPKISIPKFSGNLLAWRHFKDTFESIVHNEPTLSDIERLHYLLGALTGEAASLVSGFPVEKESYQQAWDKLLATYNNSRVLARLYIQRILDSSVKGIRDEAKRYEVFLSDVAENIESFNRLNLEKPDEFILSILALRSLDEDTRRIFELTRSSTEEFPTASEVIEFITKRMTALKFAKDPPSRGSGSTITHNHRYNSSVGPRRNFRNSSVVFHTSSCDSTSIASKRFRFEAPNLKKDRPRKPHREDKPSLSSKEGRDPTRRPETCPFCDGTHILPYCPKFHEAGLQDRIGFVKGWKGCLNCLKADHTLSKCKSNWTCRYCRQKHHSLIHQSQFGSSSSSSHSTTPRSAETFTGFGSTPSHSKSVALLGTLEALIEGKHRVFPIRAVLDSGSQHTFMTKSVADRLGHPIAPFSAHVTGLGGASVSQPLGMVSCSIKSYSTSDKFSVQAVIVHKISPLLPSATIDAVVVKGMDFAELADQNFNSPGPIDLLLGIDIYPLIVKGAPERIGADGLFILPTAFGMVVIGTAQGSLAEQTSISFFTDSSQEISSNLRTFWEIEEPCPITRIDPDDLYCEQHFVETHSRDKNGRYIVRLPIKANSSPLQPNRDVVTKRFSSLERKMCRDSDLSIKYKDFMKEYEDLGHMSGTRSPSTYIIPHHGVWQQRAEGAKLRVVFDASCGPHSLNDILLPGPKLQSDICHILILFRTYVIPLCTDIIKMYRQIIVHPEDRHLQHIFWRSNPAEALLEYELNTVTYGVRSSAFQALRVIRQLVIDEGADFPLAAARISSSMYVDDFVSGANTMEEAIELKRQLIELFSRGGFSLSKWASTVNQLLPDDSGMAPSLNITEQDAGNQKILGLQWNPNMDIFTYVVRQPPLNRVTKRTVLSAIARIFDPLGLLAPVTFQAKVLLQNVWKCNADWDESLPSDIVAAWQSLVQEWHVISSIKIPRYFGSYKASCVVVGFCDASEKGYAANVYIRAEQPNGSVKVSLMKAKTKVAPLKYVSIARLELCGALLLARLLSSLDLSSLTDKPPVCFSDSTVVLAWLRKPSHELKVFEANRVAQVMSTIPLSCWRHVRSEDNPADIGSRGCGARDLYSSHLWWHGPFWLSRQHNEWPQPISFEEQTIGCMIATNEVRKVEEKVLSDEWMERFSSFRTLVRTTARILRLTRKVRPLHDGPITAEEFRNAMRRCILLVQRLHLPGAMFKSLQVPKPYDQLHPFVDELDIVKVGGRLNNAPIQASSRHPILIPRNCHLAQLLVDDVHERHFHAGPTLVQALLRQEYWIPGAMKFIRGRILRCVHCRIVRSKPMQPAMAPLPTERFAQFRAFLQTGLDYAGPFLIKESTRRNAALGKAYLCIFVCMSSKAVHLEAVSSLSTPAFLAALDRFVARRGLPQQLHSDHGSNFIGASRFLKEVYKFVFRNEPTIIDYLAPKNVQWRFIPPGTPHFGGLWEAGVKSVKNLLAQSMGKHPYTFEELSTALTKIEGLLNSRPIYALTEDADDCDYLTPGHFLIGSSLSQIPDSVESPALSTSSRWKALRNQVCHIWNRWRTQYLHCLQQRKKWTKNVPNLKSGDLVILLEKKSVLGHWPVARVQDVHPGKDSITRVVTVRTPSGKTFVRSACSLAPLFPLGSTDTPTTDNTSPISLTVNSCI